jgi:NodT family efflux transporter outer membrane factor (OMF) lipoprotein
MTLRALFLAALLILIAGCVKAPVVRPPKLAPDVPDRWTAAETPAGHVQEGWWEAFGDPVLTGLVEQALENNHDLRVAAARLEQAGADERIAREDLKPAVSAGVSGARRRQNFIGFPDFGPAPDPDGTGPAEPEPRDEQEVVSTTSTTLGTSLDISWEIDLWGRLRAGAQAALADLQAASADYRAARLSLAAQTAKAWFAAAEASEQLALAEATVESWRTSSEQVRRRYERGLRPSLDVRLSISNYESAEALLQQRRQQLDAAIRRIEVLLGRYPGRQLETPRELHELSSQVPAGLPADLVSRRPDLVAAERRLAAADARLAVARRSLYPRFALTASGGTATDELKNLLDGDFRVWSLLANLTQPLFQGGRLRAGVDRAESGSEAALESYAGTALRAFSEVELALAAEQFLAEREAHQREAAEQAEEARRLAEDRYRSGLEGYVTILESQRRELAARSLLLVNRLLRLNNRVDLYLALGGGFQRPSDLPPQNRATASRQSEEPPS